MYSIPSFSAKDENEIAKRNSMRPSMQRWQWTIYNNGFNVFKADQVWICLYKATWNNSSVPLRITSNINGFL